jgi:hypothetical protein
VGVSYGLGHPYSDLSDEAISQIGLYSMASGFGSILATCWSKTSFAITLLRISDGKMRYFLWFIIISTNLVLGSNGVIHWVQCWPVQKTWHYHMPGSCLPADLVRNYNTAVASTCHPALTSLPHTWGPQALTMTCSFLGCDGHRPCPPSMEYHLGYHHQQT